MAKMFKVCVVVFFLLAGISLAENKELHPNVKKYLEEMKQKQRAEKEKKQEKARQDRARKSTENLEEKAKDREKEREEYRISNDLHQTFVLWAESGKDSDREKLGQAINEAISVDEIRMRGSFTLGQIAYLSGDYSKAAAILEEGIKLHPEQRVNSSKAMPMRITGRFWLAAMHRQSGNYSKAVKEYKALQSSLNLEDDGERLVSVICSLYLAEIASEYKGDKSGAISELVKVDKVKKSSEPDFAEIFDFYCRWASYERIKLLKGHDLAGKTITFGEGAESLGYFLFMAYPAMVGMCPDSRLPLNVIDAMQEKIFLHADKTKKKSLDREILLLYLGYDNERRKKYDQAIFYHSGLFEKKSFLSPIAGVYLSASKDKQGKYAQADNILEDVKNRYPGYGEMISRIKKERVKRRRKRDE